MNCSRQSSCRYQIAQAQWSLEASFNEIISSIRTRDNLNSHMTWHASCARVRIFKNYLLISRPAGKSRRRQDFEACWAPSTGFGSGSLVCVSDPQILAWQTWLLLISPFQCSKGDPKKSMEVEVVFPRVCGAFYQVRQYNQVYSDVLSARNSGCEKMTNSKCFLFLFFRHLFKTFNLRMEERISTSLQSKCRDLGFNSI